MSRKVKVIVTMDDIHGEPERRFEVRIEEFLKTIQDCKIIKMYSTFAKDRYFFFCTYDDMDDE